MQTNKRKAYSLEEKQQVIIFYQLNPLYTQRQLSSKFNMPLSVINNILSKQDIIKNKVCNVKGMKRIRTTFKTKTIDCQLFEWFMIKRKKHITITDDILKSMALKLAEAFNISPFTASSGWLQSFKKRHNIASKVILGEEGLVDERKVEDFKDIISNKLLEYEPRNIYNCDETGLFFKCTPNRTLAIRNDDRTCGRFSKERVTILFCVNMIGEKLKPLMIGSAKNPRGFKNIDFKKLDLSYDFSKKSWMTVSIFCKWLETFNRQLLLENRKILLILDNAPVHPVGLEYSNIEMLYLPPNTTSKIQALDQGIILSFKQHYKKILTRNLVFESESANVDYHFLINNFKLIDAVNVTIQAWNNVTMNVVQNCFQKAMNNCHIDCTDFKKPECDDNDFPTFDQLQNDDDDFIKHLICQVTEATDLSNESEEENNPEKEIICTPYDAYLSVMNLEKFFLLNIPEKLSMIHEIKDELLKEKRSRPVSMLDFLTRN